MVQGLVSFACCPHEPAFSFEDMPAGWPYFSSSLPSSLVFAFSFVARRASRTALTLPRLATILIGTEDSNNRSSDSWL
jgi:hypothetical protein